MISILKETLQKPSSNLENSKGILEDLILVLKQLSESEDVDLTLSSRITLEFIPKVQWIENQLPEIDKLGWKQNESWKLRGKIRKVEQELRKNLERIRMSLVRGASIETRRLLDRAFHLSVDASFSYLRLGEK